MQLYFGMEIHETNCGQKKTTPHIKRKADIGKQNKIQKLKAINIQTFSV